MAEDSASRGFYQPQDDTHLRGSKRDVPAWGKESLHLRLHRCRAMLSLHGFLGDKFNLKLRDRIDKRHASTDGSGA
jgi:hypothetical protein